jgi:hypothetical protein
LTSLVFTRAEKALSVDFATAAARLAHVGQDSWLDKISADSYEEGLTGLTKVGPFGPNSVVSKLVKVNVRDVVRRGDNAVLTLRWEATGPGGGLFPALDADITLVPEGDRASRLILDGVYRPPLAGLGAGLDRVILRHIANSTAKSLLDEVAGAICRPA